jgi:hypothetical protein
MAYRLPQLLSALDEWLTVEVAAGRVADDHRRPPGELAAKVRGVRRCRRLRLQPGACAEHGAQPVGYAARGRAGRAGGVSGARAARHGRAVEPLSFRGQFFQDMTVAMGPGVVGGLVVNSLQSAVCCWQAAYRPVPRLWRRQCSGR